MLLFLPETTQKKWENTTALNKGSNTLQNCRNVGREKIAIY